MKIKVKGILFIFIFLLLSYNAHANDTITWTFKTSGKVIAAPIIQNDTLFLGSLDGNFYAIDATTGNEIWKYNTNNEIRTTAVIYNKEIICFESGNTMYGLDLGGNLLWSQVIHSGTLINEHDQWDCFRSSPTLHDSIAYIGSESGKVVGVQVVTGEIVFSVQTPQANTTIETTPVIYNNKIFVGDWLGVFSVFNIETSELVWQYDTKKDNTYQYWVNAIISKPLIYNNTVYFAGRNCNLYAFNPDTGEKLWMYHSPTDQWLIGGPVVSEDVLYVGSSYQTMLFAFNSNNPELLWETYVGGLNYGDPVVVEDYVIVGTGAQGNTNVGSIAIINKTTHKAEDTYDVNGWVQTTPLVQNGIIYFGCFNGNIYAWDMKGLLPCADLFNEEAEIYNGESYDWRGDQYTEAGVYFDTVATDNGCDSIFQLTLTVTTAIESKYNEMFYVGEVFPNPSYSEATVTINLKNDGLLTIALVNIQGIEVKPFINEYKKAGTHTIHLNTQDITSGVYLCRFSMQNQSIIKKVVIN